MPLFLTSLFSFFGWVVGAITEFFGKRIALGVVVTSTFLAIAAAVYGALLAAATGLQFAAPAWVTTALQGVAVFLPSNFDTCVSVLVAAHLAAKLYEMQLKWLNLMTQVH